MSVSPSERLGKGITTYCPGRPAENNPVYPRLRRIMRYAGVSALAQFGAACGCVAQLGRLVRWQRKAEEWQAIAGLATTAPLHRWAIHTAASALDRDGL
jgi:hypothetical protein